MGNKNLWEKSHRTKLRECQYCENPELHDLEGIAIPERKVEQSQLDKVIRFTDWHYERHQWISWLPKKRIRCQRN